MSGQVITFYSYKGGTGRTMALANVATLLSEKHKVLMVDWDLEAPGLHYFFKNKVVSNASEKSGLIELFKEIKESLDQHPEWNSDQVAKSLFDSLNFGEYLYTVKKDKLQLLAAGKLNEDYPRQVATFQWEALFYRAPWLFRAFAKYLTGQFDYVLIDSRTGLNDISGICTTLMPEKLVAVFTPSHQSITGIISSIKSALQFRNESDDLRPLNIFPLPSRMELQEKVLFDDWRFGTIADGIEGYQPLFEELLKNSYNLEECNLENYFKNILVQQFTYYAYGENIAVSETQGTGRLSLSESYTLFTEILTNSIAPWTIQDFQPKLSIESNKQTDVQVSRKSRKHLDAVRIQLQSNLPSYRLQGMQGIKEWLNESPEDREVYGLLLDAVRENRDLREQVRDLLLEMSKKGAKSAEQALSVLPSSLQDLLADADDAYYAAEFEKAIFLYRQILKIDPNNDRAKNQLTKAEISRTETVKSNTGLPQEAMQFFRQARSYIAARDYRSAIAMLSASLDSAHANDMDFPEAETLLNSIQDFLMREELEERAEKARQKREIIEDIKRDDRRWLTIGVAASVLAGLLLVAGVAASLFGQLSTGIFAALSSIVPGFVVFLYYNRSDKMRSERLKLIEYTRGEEQLVSDEINKITAESPNKEL